ncbi:MAG: DUF4286 family protein [Bacteroidia bacterium]|nr:DUF4286 family protein [Bacteroidia bacterium]
MFIYSVTVNIDNDINHAWLAYMQNTHIPEVLQCGLFVEAKLCKVLALDQEGITYNVQYLLRSQADYETYQLKFAPTLQADHTEKFKGKFVAFRTLVEVIETFVRPC